MPPTQSSALGAITTPEQLPEVLAALRAQGYKRIKTIEPNACRHCSSKINETGELEPYRLKRGTGYDPLNPGQYCPVCAPYAKFHEALRGYGPQAYAGAVPYFEILAGGAKAGGKSHWGSVAMLKGNPLEPQYDAKGNPIWVNQSYAFHPAYRGLVLRRNLDDLKAWIEGVRELYASYRGQFVNGEFRFESGAVIWLGHLEDASSWMKYAGMPELHRLYIEEANQISRESNYERVRSCVRTTHPELHEQIYLTGNWEGPGLFWLRKRFLEQRDKTGRTIPPLEPIIETFEDKGKTYTTSRVFVPMRLEDNPHITQTYRATLLSLVDEKQRKVYLEGDPYAFAGSYFENYRPNGPSTGEPDNANHIIRKNDKRPWNRYHNTDNAGYPKLEWSWPRAIGIDWGYQHNCAVYWLCRHPLSGQLHVYRELILQRVAPIMAGQRIAEAIADELHRYPDQAIRCYLSWDAFGVRGSTGDLSNAELIQLGVEDVLGPDSTYLPEVVIRQAEELAEARGVEQAREALQKMRQEIMASDRRGVTFLKAGRQNIVGWNLIREALTWERPGFEQQNREALMSRLGKVHPEISETWSEPLDAMRQPVAVHRPRVLPELQVWDTCPELMMAFPRAMHAENVGANPEDMAKEHFEGRDSLDALRHGVVGMRDQFYDKPWDIRRDEAIEQYRHEHPDASVRDLIWVNRQLEARAEPDSDTWRVERSSVQSRVLRRSAQMRTAWPAR